MLNVFGVLVCVDVVGGDLGLVGLVLVEFGGL